METSATAEPGLARPGLATGFLGCLDYAQATGLQNRIRDALEAGVGLEHLLLLEHPHIYTCGRNASRADLVASPAWLAGRGVAVEESDRGGQVTYHGPGQLVGYPILDLNPDRRDIRRYVCDLQEVLIRTLRDFAIDAEPGLPDRPAGVWVGEHKIASIGVHLRRWLTTHGFALNVSTDLAYFSGIVPCGLTGVKMTSMKNLGAGDTSLADVANSCSTHFCEVFGRRPRPLDIDLGMSNGARKKNTPAMFHQPA